MLERATSQTTTWKYAYFVYALLVVAGIVNLVLTLRLPMEGLHKGDSTIPVVLIQLSIVFMQFCIWIIAVMGATRLMNYAQGIKDTLDGKGLVNIARALFLLIVYIISLPITTILSDIALRRHDSQLWVELHNHLPLLILIFAVGFLYYGSRQLARLSNHDMFPKRWRIIVLSTFTIVAAAFAAYFYEVVPPMIEQGSITRFTISAMMLLFSYVAPLIAAWLFAVLAILNLWQYSTQVEGAIYRQLFRNLYQGIILVFLCTLLAQLLIASTITLSGLSPGIYMIHATMLLLIFGFIQVYRGVQHLAKIEAVAQIV